MNRIAVPRELRILVRSLNPAWAAVRLSRSAKAAWFGWFPVEAVLTSIGIQSLNNINAAFLTVVGLLYKSARIGR